MSALPFRLHEALNDPGCNVETIENLLKENVNIEVFNKEGQRPIHVAVANPHCSPKVIALLISKGASVDAKNYREETPLHLAIKQLNCKYDIVKMLLNNHCDVNAQDSFRNTPLHIAVQTFHYNLPVIALLLYYKADVMVTNKEGLIPLYLAFENPNCSVDLVKILMKRFDYRIFNHSRFTPLQTYIKRHSFFRQEIFEELVNQGANPWRKSEFSEMNILHHAVSAKNSFIILSTIIKIILKHKHNYKISDMINEADINLNTPLHLALQVDHIDLNVISLLLKHGANPNKSIIYKNPLSLAIKACDHKAVELLLLYGASVHRLLSLEPVALIDLIGKFVFDREKYRSCFWTVIKYYAESTFYHEGENALKNCKDFMGTVLSLKDLVDVKNFIDECCRELLQMKKEMLTNNCSLYNFVFRRPKYPAIKYSTKNLLSVSNCLNYKIYHNRMANLFDKSQLLSELQIQQIYVENNGVKITLVPDCCISVGYYLSNEDLLSFILAFYKPIDQQNLKGKSIKRPSLENFTDCSGKRCKITVVNQ